MLAVCVCVCSCAISADNTGGAFSYFPTERSAVAVRQVVHNIKNTAVAYRMHVHRMHTITGDLGRLWADKGNKWTPINWFDPNTEAAVACTCVPMCVPPSNIQCVQFYQFANWLWTTFWFVVGILLLWYGPLRLYGHGAVKWFQWVCVWRRRHQTDCYV